MEVREDYKRTEIGIFPTDWEIDKIKNIALIGTGSKNTEDKIDFGKYPFFVRSQTVEKINSYAFDGEAVLTAGDGVGTGKIYHYINGKFNFHQRVYKISNFSSTVDGYFFYVYFSNNFFSRIMSMTAKSSVDSVRKDMISEMLIPIPPKDEQLKISKLLSDTDELISSLEKLIEKKRQIKQGAMQQLLTGKKRLPGFSGKWEVKKLGLVAEIQRGASPRPIDSPRWYSITSSIGWVRISDVTSSNGRILEKTDDYLSKEGVDRSRFLRKGSLIMSICATVGLPVITNIDVCIHDGFVGFSNLKNVDVVFLLYKLKELENLFKTMGQTGSQSNLNTDLVKNYEINFPPIDEQNAIAQFLSDIDSEIEMLEQKLNKYKSIKQGMMQVLLTGKIRLVKP